jgi:hypothetical protein
LAREEKKRRLRKREASAERARLGGIGTAEELIGISMDAIKNASMSIVALSGVIGNRGSGKVVFVTDFRDDI